jgi:Na+/melibiose symporter-like transporter
MNPPSSSPSRTHHELAAVEPQDVGDRRLRLACSFAQQCEDAVLVHRDALLFERLDHPCLDVPAGIAVLALTPFLLRESKADLDHRHFDTAGAASITGGLMLLVYALTRATQARLGDALDGWAAGRIGCARRRVRRDRTTLEGALLPLGIFRLRTLTASNVSGLLLAGAMSSQFFLLTLYMQQVLHYSALKTGVAYVGITLTIIAFSAVAQALTTRIGVRPLLPLGMLLAAVGLVLYTQLPVHGHYFWDLFPAFIIGGVGLALAFVPMSIGALTGVRAREAGVASGLLNTSQQVGGAIGVAVASTIAATYTSHYVSAHPGSNPASAAALTHGFKIAFWVLAGIAIVGAVLATVLVESRSRIQETGQQVESVPAFEEAV